MGNQAACLVYTRVMKYVVILGFAAVLVVGSIIGGYYFVARPIQESNARKYCGSQAHKEVLRVYGFYGAPDDRSETYDLSYRSCLNQQGF
jgi:hypothetical protein